MAKHQKATPFPDRRLFVDFAGHILHEMGRLFTPQKFDVSAPVASRLVVVRRGEYRQTSIVVSEFVAL
jgi:hypothetical protein